MLLEILTISGVIAKITSLLKLLFFESRDSLRDSTLELADEEKDDNFPWEKEEEGNHASC